MRIFTVVFHEPPVGCLLNKSNMPASQGDRFYIGTLDFYLEMLSISRKLSTSNGYPYCPANVQFVAQKQENGEKLSPALEELDEKLNEDDNSDTSDRKAQARIKQRH